MSTFGAQSIGIRQNGKVKLFTKQQARIWLRENNLKTRKSIEGAFIAEIKDVLQEILEEMASELGYAKYE